MEFKKQFKEVFFDFLTIYRFESAGRGFVHNLHNKLIIITIPISGQWDGFSR